MPSQLLAFLTERSTDMLHQSSSYTKGQDLLAYADHVWKLLLKDDHYYISIGRKYCKFFLKANSCLSLDNIVYVQI